MADAPAAPYPVELEGDAALRDGTRVRIRPIRPDDAPRLVEAYDHLSRYSAYQRFFTVMKRLPPDWARVFANVDYRGRLALIAEDAATGELIAVARYEVTSQDDTAEIAFTVLDAWQNRGLGTVLLDRILAAGEARGIRRFLAYVLADNRRMLDLLVRNTDVLERRTESGLVTLVARRRVPEVRPAPR